METFVSLTDIDLVDLGIAEQSTRERILNEVQRLNAHVYEN